MPKAGPVNKPLGHILKSLSQEGKAWVQAEARLAQAEVSAVANRYWLTAILLAGMFLTAFGAFAWLSIAVAVLLASYVGGLAYAALWISGSLALICLLFTVLIKRQHTVAAAEITSAVKRWGTTVARLLDATR